SEERIEGYKHFVNKIWNAARLCMMNLEGYPDGPVSVKKEDYSLADRWIRARLNGTIADVTRSLDEYRFNDAAAHLYRFVWQEFCDWYLELIKPALYGRDNPAARLAAQETMLTVLRSSLELLHPFMPFVTEEIWQKIAKGPSIMVAPFPTADERFKDDEAERDMGLLMEVIGSIRNIKGEKGISPSKKLKALVTTEDRSLLPLLESGAGYVVNLARLESLSIVSAGQEPKDAATGVAGPVKVFVILEGGLDRSGEKARLEKEMARVEKELAQVNRKLENPDFWQKAAQAVIDKEEAKARALNERFDILQEALRKL
ncbi:MAG TPA: class I tRNA ligase family protein, partial [Syntrophales bacterium]|nr:class I tRNA ligase family protein [Syntrophales bacterium]